MADIILTEDDVKRFWLKTRWNPWNGCLEWVAGRTPGGYGKYHINRVGYPAHRIAWVIANGPIPSGLFVCHRCDNPPCLNVDHLFLGTAADNNADMKAKGRTKGANQTECAHGHPYSGENLLFSRKGGKVCRTCRDAASAAYRAANPSRVREANRAWYEEHREAEIARSRARYMANRDVLRAAQRVRYAAAKYRPQSGGAS